MAESVSSVALGFFDGLHHGHLRVLESALDNCKVGMKPVVLLFDEHPATVLSGIRVPELITPEDRDAILGKMGFTIVVKSFREICTMSPREFFDKILIDELGAAAVSCGFNYSFGAGGAGNAALLGQFCEEDGVFLSVSEEVTVEGEAVSSTLIRKLIAEGEIEKANRLLGRNYSFATEVFSGDHRGRKLGSPTINQYLPEGLVIPKFGVYAANVFVGEKKYCGVANIGNRPTFDGSSVRSETFILDFEGDLYGKKPRIELLEFVRPEKKFSSVEELVFEIQENALYVRNKYHN